MSLVLLTAILLAVIYLVVLPDGFKLADVFGPSSSSSCNNNGPAASTTSAVQQLAGGGAADLRVFMGILTVPGAYERPAPAVVDVRFVFLRRRQGGGDRVLVSLEIIAHVRRHPGAQLHREHERRRQDARLLLGRAARGSSRRSRTTTWARPIDDDTYYRVASLADSLRGAARRDAYHGYLTPCCHYWKPEGAVHGRDDAVRRVVGRGGVDRGDAGAPRRPGGPRLRRVAAQGGTVQECVEIETCVNLHP